MPSRSSVNFKGFLNLFIDFALLFLIYIVIKAITGAGAFFDVIGLISIIVLVFPENFGVTKRYFLLPRLLYTAVELIIVISLLGGQFLAWQIAVALLWIKILNILIAMIVSRVNLEFRVVHDGYRRRVTFSRGDETGEVAPRPTMQRKVLYVSLILILVALPLTFGIMQGTTAVLGNANYLDNMIQKSRGYPSFFSFNSSDVRLVTADVAYAKAKQHMASFGSNVEVQNTHLTIWNGELAWTMSVVQQYWLGAGYDQHVYGYIVLSATDPNEPPKLVHQELALAMGTDLNNRKDVLMQAYYRNPNYRYDRAILTMTPEGKVVYALPKYAANPSLLLATYGVDIWDAMTGAYLESFEMTNMPAWIPQPFDEGWIARQITNWGASRRGSSFDIFAGGFIGVSVSNDRVEMDEDTRFLRYGNELMSFTSMHPYSTEQTLAGIFITDHTGIKYFDVSQLNMLSASRAKDVVQSQLYLPSAGEFVVEMPVLYNMSNYMAWLSPVYYVTGDTWQLKFIGIVNALDQSDVAVQDVTGMSAQVGVETVAASFVSLVSSKQNLGTSIQGLITGKWSYETAGNTNYYVNITYGSTWKLLHGAQSNMPTNDWLELVISSLGNHANSTYIVVGTINEIIRFDVAEF